MLHIRRVLVGCGVAAVLALVPAAGAGAAPVSAGHSGWTWGSPTPQGDDLSAVAFQGATGYAVGLFGTALRSTDGGATWSGLPTGSINDLSVVQELDPNTVVVGGQCYVAESTDGGASFSALPISPSNRECEDEVMGLSFTSASTGYVLQQSGQVSFTSDGGRSVEAKTPVPVPEDALADGLTFTSSTTGFALAGGTIQRTTDSANSWTQVASSPHGLNGLTFVNATTAFAVGDSGTLLESTDAGATWTVRPLTGASGLSLTHISCSDPSNCLISIANSRSVIRTTDGGATATLVTPSASDIADVAYSSGTNVVGVGQGGATVLSTDGGAQFPTLISGGFTGAISSAAPLPLRAGGVAGSAYLMGAGGVIEATTDGGGTWKVLRVPGGGDTIDAAFPTVTDGYTVGDDNVLRRTTNGGATWSSLDAGVGNSTRLAATGADTVLLIGPVGIRRSTDRGQTFTKVSGTVKTTGKGTHKKAGPKVSSLKLARSLTVGHTVFAWSGTVAYESTNGGTAFKALPLPRKTKITDLSFVSPSTGYVVDRGGDVLKTHNGGTTWTKVVSLGTTDATGVSFATPSRGMVVLHLANGDQTLADVLVTTNGGTTWQPQFVNGSSIVDRRFDLAAVLDTPGHAYFADPDTEGRTDVSSVFATSNGGASPKSSRLSISIGPKKLTRAALKRKHNDRVTVKGKLSPVTADGEQVQVSYRKTTGRFWTSTRVRVATNGSFQITLKHITASTDIVVLADGDGVHGGAGAHARLTVK
jgi:photosystem II stability/assembly factor-like uncharacterized protein